jgi:hypothetical protein
MDLALLDIAPAGARSRSEANLEGASMADRTRGCPSCAPGALRQRRLFPTMLKPDKSPADRRP